MNYQLYNLIELWDPKGETADVKRERVKQRMKKES